MKETYDVIVIGSGFGGAVTACRLAQAGRSVCILERGRRWKKEEFPRTTGQAARAFWRPDKSYGFIEYHAFKRIDVIQGSGVGGGSLHYFNVQFRPPREIFEHSAWPREVTGDKVSPYYDLVKDMLDAGPLTPPAGRQLPAKTEAFFAACRGTGKTPGLADIAVYTGPERTNPHGGVPQSACVYSGDCMLGCHVHAKNTLDLNYIPLAERHGARVLPLHQAEKIEQEGGEYRVHFWRLDEARPGLREPGSVAGRIVIISAGSLGSTELLLKCRDEHGTLPQLSGALGSRFSGNGDFILAGTLDADRNVDPGHGPNITAFADFSTPANRITIEDLSFAEPAFWFIEGAMPPTESRLRNLSRFLKTYLLQSLRIGTRSSLVSDEIQAILSGSRTARFLPYLGMGTDAADGSLRLHNGAIDIDWSHRASRQMFEEIEKAMKDLSRSLGGKYVTSFLWRWPLRKLLTAHPLGGCVMGDNAAAGVVNHCGEVWNYPGLYVADGSVIPTALSVNPSMTIAALAERTAFWILNGRDMEINDPNAPKNYSKLSNKDKQ